MSNETAKVADIELPLDQVTMFDSECIGVTAVFRGEEHFAICWPPDDNNKMRCTLLDRDDAARIAPTLVGWLVGSFDAVTEDEA